MSTEEFKRRLTAILSADVQGYSRLMADDEEATVRTINAYRELMIGQINGHAGRVVDAKGDNVLAEFSSVVDAVRSAVEIQKELKERNSELPEHRRMEFRIGINLGDVIDEEGTIYGDGVNVAARLEGLAEGGGICISGTAFDQVKNRVSVGYEYRGKQTVKNISDPVRVYKVLMGPEAAGKVIGEEEPRRAKRRWVAMAAVAVLAVVAGGLIWNFYFRTPSLQPASKDKMAFPLPDKPSIAVLPFVNMSSNLEYESLADSLSENIIYTLSYLAGMFVVARNSTFFYKGKPVEIRQVAEQLGVRYVLEGSVLRAEDRVRVTAQLIDATTGYHLWSGRFDRTVKDIFSLLDEITKSIAIELQVKVSPDQWVVLSHKTDNFDAWAASTRAYGLLLRGAVEEAQGLAEKAVSLDPKYGFGWGILAALHTLKVIYGLTQSPAESMKLAAECNEKSLTLDPTLSCSTANRGQIYLLQGKVEEAIALCKKAIDMAPSLDTNYIIFGVTMDFAGRFEEAIPLFKTAMRLNPFYPARYLQRYGMSCLMAGRKEEALTAFKELLQRAQKDGSPLLAAHLGLCAVYAELGKEEEAKTHALEILKINPNFSVEEAKKVHRWRDPKYSERWLSSLRRAGLPAHAPLPLPDKPSIAVLPFVNMSEDIKQEFLSDAITENIITALSKMSNLFVIARNSTFTYKGKPVKVQQVAEDLGVRYVLEGSVQKSGDRVRITAQFIDALKGNHMWSERYDRDLKDLFAIEDDITKKIITALQVILTQGEQARLRGKGTDNLDAYLKCLEARELIYRFNKDATLLARQRAEEAIALDPEYSSAHAILGKTHIMDIFFGWSASPRESLGRAFESAKTAIALDDSDFQAHLDLSLVYLLKREHDKAVEEGEGAVSLAPNAADALFSFGIVLRFAGRVREAIPLVERAIRLNPIPPASYLYELATCYNFIGKFEKAIGICKEALPKNPDDLKGRLILVVAYSSLGREDEARTEVSEVLRIDPKFSLEYASRTWPYKNNADRDLVLNALRKAGLK